MGLKHQSMNQQALKATTDEPEGKTLDISRLRQEGMRYIKELSGNIWTDHNLHDPGITVLEMLCYALTDLSYRTGLDMEDILARQEKQEEDFFTAAQILTTAPVTVKDYRKLLLDNGFSKDGKRWLRNAWVIPLPPPVEDPKDPLRNYEGLYDVLLELEDEDENDGNIVLNVEIDGEENEIEMTLPTEWENSLEQGGKVTSYQKKGSKIEEKGGKVSFNYLNPQGKTNPFFVDFRSKKPVLENHFRMTRQNSIFSQFQEAVNAYLELRKGKKEAIKLLLAANRNLCEDFLEPQIVKRNYIVIEAVIDVAIETEVEELLAEIFYEVDKMLSPPVRFYTLEEMRQKGKRTEEIFEGPAMKHGFIDDDELKDIEEESELFAGEILRAILLINKKFGKRVIRGVKELRLSNYKLKDANGNPTYEQESNDCCIQLSDVNLYRPRLDVETSIKRFSIEHDGSPIDTSSMVSGVMAKFKNKKEALSSESFGETDLPIPSGKVRSLDQYHSIQRLFPLAYGIGDEGLPATATEKRKIQNKQFKTYLLFFEQLLADYLTQLLHAKDFLSIGLKPDRSYFRQALDKVPAVGELLGKGYEGFIAEKWDNDRSQDDWPPSPDQDRRSRILDHLLARFGEQFVDFPMFRYLHSAGHVQTDFETYLNKKHSFLRNIADLSSNRGKGFNYLPSRSISEIVNPEGGSFSSTNIFPPTESSILPNVNFLRPRSSLEEKLISIIAPSVLAGESMYLIEHLLLRSRDPSSTPKERPDLFSFRITLLFGYMNPNNRFANLGFQEYVEHLVKVQAPANVRFKIEWVYTEQNKYTKENWIKMDKAYQDWCKEMAKMNPGLVELDRLSNDLSRLILQSNRLFPL